MRIREATTEDAEILAKLSPQLGYPADASAVARRLDQMAATRAGTILVAESDDGVVVGWAEASLQRHLVHDARL